jgi:7-cyano-7-deazaguanine synthase
MGRQVVVLSGGMDSGTLLWHVAATTDDPIMTVSFNYNQRHKRELTYATALVRALGLKYEGRNICDITVDLSHLAQLIAGQSALVNPDVAVPHGHYAEDSMKATVVPNRNMIMTSIAAGIAVANDGDAVWLGVHAGDHFVYPDCRPEFFNALNQAVQLGNEGFGNGVYLETPFINWTKAEIAEHGGKNLDVPYILTWSCYEGGVSHCGRCGTCVERKEAFREAHVVDPTLYDDPNFKIEAYRG